MAQDIYEGRCKDCFNKRPALTVLTGITLMNPVMPGMELCEECTSKRREEVAASKPARPIGIPFDHDDCDWHAVKPVTLKWKDNRSSPIIVEIKVRVPKDPSPQSENGGEVRMRIDDNQYWTYVDHFDFIVPGRNLEWCLRAARSSTRTVLGRQFPPEMEVVLD